MPCFRAYSSARPWSRAATATTTAFPVRRAGLTRAVGVILAAPRTPNLTTRRARLRNAGETTDGANGIGPVQAFPRYGTEGERRGPTTVSGGAARARTLTHLAPVRRLAASAASTASVRCRAAILAFHTGLNSVPGGDDGVDASLLLRPRGGAWACRLPRSTPRWFTSLPSQESPRCAGRRMPTSRPWLRSS